MDKLDQISLTELMIEAIEAKKLLYRVLTCPKDMQALISMPLVPYLSLICDGLDSFLGSSGSSSKEFEDILGVPFTKLIRNSRSSVKLLSDKKKLAKINKILKNVSDQNNELLRLGYGEIQLDFIELFGQADLGVFSYLGTPYANTFQISIYFTDILFHNIDYIKSKEEMDNHIKNAMIHFSSSLARYISSASQPFEEKWGVQFEKDEVNSDLNIDYFSATDYFYSDENRRNVFTDRMDKEIQLHLFNSLCQLNYIGHVLVRLLGPSNALFVRIKLIAYLSAVMSLENLYSSNIMLEDPLEKRVNEIIKNKEMLFEKESYLRNNIFHYKIVGLDESLFDNTANILATIIEAKSNYTIDNFISEIDCEIDIITQLISELIGY